MSFSHVDFKELIDRVAPELTPGESLAVRAVSWHETNYASGWRTPEARASRNLGAITRQPLEKLDDGSVICEPPNFAHGDSLRDQETGKVVQYQTCFAGYDTFEAAAEDLVRTVLKDNVSAFARRGSLRGVAKAMRKNRYYLGTAPTEAEQVNAYLSALERAVSDITERTGEPNPFVVVAAEAQLSPPDLPLGSMSSFVPSSDVPEDKVIRRTRILAEHLERRERRSEERQLARQVRSAPVQEAMRRMARMYLEHVPASYLHIAIALRNLGAFDIDALRGELTRRSEPSSFPSPQQAELERIEHEARELERAAEEADQAEWESESESEPDPFEGVHESTIPPPASEPVTAPESPQALDKEQDK